MTVSFCSFELHVGPWSYTENLLNEILAVCVHWYSSSVYQKRLGDPEYGVTYIIPSSSWGSETSLRECLCHSLLFAVTENLTIIGFHCSK